MGERATSKFSLSLETFKLYCPWELGNIWIKKWFPQIYLYSCASYIAKWQFHHQIFLKNHVNLPFANVKVGPFSLNFFPKWTTSYSEFIKVKAFNYKTVFHVMWKSKGWFWPVFPSCVTVDMHFSNRKTGKTFQFQRTAWMQHLYNRNKKMRKFVLRTCFTCPVTFSF